MGARRTKGKMKNHAKILPIVFILLCNPAYSSGFQYVKTQIGAYGGYGFVAMDDANNSAKKRNEKFELYGFEGRYALIKDAGMAGLKVSSVFKTPFGFVGIDILSDYIMLPEKNNTIYWDNGEKFTTFIQDINSLYIGAGIKYYLVCAAFTEKTFGVYIGADGGAFFSFGSLFVSGYTYEGVLDLLRYAVIDTSSRVFPGVNFRLGAEYYLSKNTGVEIYIGYRIAKGLINYESRALYNSPGYERFALEAEYTGFYFKTGILLLL